MILRIFVKEKNTLWIVVLLVKESQGSSLQFLFTVAITLPWDKFWRAWIITLLWSLLCTWDFPWKANNFTNNTTCNKCYRPLNTSHEECLFSFYPLRWECLCNEELHAANKLNQIPDQSDQKEEGPLNPGLQTTLWTLSQGSGFQNCH